MILAAGGRSMRIEFAGSNSNAPFQAVDETKVATTYFRGHEHRSGRAYSRLRRKGVYPGIDVVYYGDGQNLEYDFELSPNADPRQIVMRFDGASEMHIDAAGGLVLQLGEHEITQRVPVVYQRTSDHALAHVAASYRMADDGTVHLELAGYDRAKPLVIDPVLELTAFFPGTGADGVAGIARDAKGFVYMAGWTYSTDFALVGDSYSPFLLNSLRDGWVMKINPNERGNDLIVYSSFFGSSATDDVMAMTVDDAGLVYMTGTTDAYDFPVTSGGYVTSFDGGANRIFVSVLDTKDGADGLRYSTYFGGSTLDVPTGIAVAGGKVYITGYTTSDDYPVVNALQSTRAGSYDAFLAVFDPAQSGTDSLPYSTYLGGTGQDLARSLAVTPEGNVYLAGGTYSVDFPTTDGAFRRNYSSFGDAFVARIDVPANALGYGTYLGASDTDQARKILLQPNGTVAVTGYTFSYDFRITQNALEPIYNGNGDIFLTILNPAASDASSLVYSTFLGGTDSEVPYDLRRDDAGKLYICGYTLSRDFPIVNGLDPVSANGGSDGFISVLDLAQPSWGVLVYSSLITGPGQQVAIASDVDSSGNILVTGISTGPVFGPGEAQPVIPSNSNVFLMMFSLDSAASQISKGESPRGFSRVPPSGLPPSSPGGRSRDSQHR